MLQNFCVLGFYTSLRSNQGKQMHKSIQVIAASILSVTAATAVYAQRQPEQWVKVVTTEDGNPIYFDRSSQTYLFDSGVKKSSFRTVTNSPEGKPLRGMRYQADCFKGTLALRSVEIVNAQGSFVRQVPLESVHKEPAVPAKDTVAEAILQYACSQF
jgi:hypothetical protein